MVAFPTVEIPGYREAVKKERTLRDSAFLECNEILCGEEVAPLSLRRLIWLEQAHNGFVCPWRWESDDEVIGHAIAFVYFLKPSFRPPSKARWTFWDAWRAGYNQHRFAVKMLRRHKPEEIVGEVGQFINDAFMDAPVGGSSNIASQSYASYPAYIFDRFGEAGLTYTPEQIMDLPLKRLWQHMRVAAARIHDLKLTNPSDELAVRYIDENLNSKRN